MKKLLTILFLLPLFAKGTTYYFSNAGSDAAAGTSEGTAWQTITKFNSFFASLAVGDQCLFRRGDTFTGTLTISRSGSSGNVITIGAYGTGAKPIITGLTAVTAWTSLGSNIYESTSAVTALTTLNMVTFQGFLQPMGRWPKLTDANQGWLLHQTHSGFTTITSNAIASALSYVGGEIVSKKYQWIIDRARITAQTSTVVTSAPLPSPAHDDFTYDFQDGHGFFFQNHQNACTVLGEWAYDSTSRKIRMNFAGGTPASYTIKVTDLESLVTISSRSYITFDNLQFIGSNSKTFNITSSNNIQINNCDLDFAGVNAIQNTSTSTNIQVYNCTINRSNNSAIYGHILNQATIQNNVITNTAVIRGMGQSGDGQYNAVSGVRDKSLVEYNEIINTGYIGVHFYGDSTVVKNNFIDSFCKVKSDGGGIYTYAETTKTGRQITGNIVLNGIGDKYGHDPGALTNPYALEVHGIYLDGGARGVAVTGNTSANCGASGIILRSTQNVQVTYNTVYNCKVAQLHWLDPNGAIATTTIKNNILFSKDKDQQIIYGKMASNYLATFGTIDSNFYCRPIYEPTGINGVNGYSNVGPNWEYESPYAPYNDGGIVDIQISAEKFYSLDTWKTYSSKDAATVKTYATVSSVNDIRFDYNATNAAVDVSLGNFTYKDVAGDSYSYSVNIPAYSSIILLNPVAIDPPPTGGSGIIIKRRVITYK